MAYYRICFIKNGRHVCFDEFSAADDVQALREAERHVGDEPAELWCGDRRVTTVRSRVNAAH